LSLVSYVSLYFVLSGERTVADSAELDMGRVHPWVGSVQVQLCGFVWVTLDDTECYAKCRCQVYI